jgi:hypothetical protein
MLQQMRVRIYIHMVSYLLPDQLHFPRSEFAGCAERSGSKQILKHLFLLHRLPVTQTLR